jgi:hypothetical protein
MASRKWLDLNAYEPDPSTSHIVELPWITGMHSVDNSIMIVIGDPILLCWRIK